MRGSEECGRRIIRFAVLQYRIAISLLLRTTRLDERTIRDAVESSSGSRVEHDLFRV